MLFNLIWLCRFRLRTYLDVLASGVDLHDARVVRKVEPELARVGRDAFRFLHQLVAFLAGALEAALRIRTRLVAKAPLVAFVPICVLTRVKALESTP